MRLRFPFLVSLSLLTACIGINTGSSTDAGAAPATASASDANANTPDAAKGIDCIVEQTTGATICSVNTLCPAVAIDHDQFPNCGFRVKGGTLDIECAC